MISCSSIGFSCCQSFEVGDGRGSSAMFGLPQADPSASRWVCIASHAARAAHVDCIGHLPKILGDVLPSSLDHHGHHVVHFRPFRRAGRGRRIRTSTHSQRPRCGLLRAWRFTLNLDFLFHRFSARSGASADVRCWGSSRRSAGVPTKEPCAVHRKLA